MTLMPVAEDLAEAGGALLAQGQITPLITDQEGRCGVRLERVQQ